MKIARVWQVKRLRGWTCIGLLLTAGRVMPCQAGEPAVPHDADAARVERLLKRHPNDPVLQYDLGTMRYRQGRYPQAADSLNDALAASGASLQSRASYNLGNTHYRLGRAAEQGKPQQAIDFYRKALRIIAWRCVGTQKTWMRSIIMSW